MPQGLWGGTCGCDSDGGDGDGGGSGECDGGGGGRDGGGGDKGTSSRGRHWFSVLARERDRLVAGLPSY